jgi:hypothetical protein
VPRFRDHLRHKHRSEGSYEKTVFVEPLRLKHAVEITLLIGCSSSELATVSGFFTELKMGHRVWLRDSAGK